MFTTNEVASITAVVPYTEDREMKYDIIPFRVFQKAETYLAIPLVPDETRTKMNLPGQLKFQIVKNRVVPFTEDNHELLGNIAWELRLLHLV